MSKSIYKREGCASSNMNQTSNTAQKPYLCTRCGRELVKRIGPAGFFWGCSYYPRCKKSFADNQGKPYIRKSFNFTCPCCQEGTLVRHKKFKYFTWICNDPLCCAAFQESKQKPNLLKQILNS